MFSKEMIKALEEDGEKLRLLTGEDHGPEFFDYDDPLVEVVARALFESENKWREMQQGLQGEQLPERHFKVAISEYRMKAREVLAALAETTFLKPSNRP